MKQGFESLEKLVRDVDSYKLSKRDYISDIRNTEMQYIGANKFKLCLEGEEVNYTVTDNAMSQIASWAKVPYSYVNYMKSNGKGDLVASNFNEWFQKPVHKNTRRMYRGMTNNIYRDNSTLDPHMSRSGGKWRSFHSNRFRRVDHEHVLDSIMPELETLAEEYGDIKIASLGLTDDKMYVKVLFPKTEAKAVGDVVQFGLSIGNSEIGKGLAYVSPLIYVLRCLNGMILPDYGIKTKHIGSSIEEDGNVTYGNDTIETDQKAIMLKLRDTIRSVCSEENRNKVLEKINESSDTTSTKNPLKAVEKTAKLFSLTEKETEDTTLSFVKRGDYSKWGMVNAVTEIANTHKNYDRASELEGLGGRILTMGKSQWQEIALAA